MSWKALGYGLESSDGAVSTTSTCTVRRTDSSGLRMYGSLEGQIAAVSTTAPNTTFAGDGSAWTDAGASFVTARIQYIEGEDPDGLFDLTSVYVTAMPAEKKGVTWDRVRASTDSAGELSLAFITADLDVWYKDASIVAIPGDSWLMLMVRCRALAAEGVAEPDPGNCISDIVAWWSPDQTFAGDEVMGPFLMVDSLWAVPGAGGVRLWLGVPGGVVNEETGELWIYFVAEENRKNSLDTPPLDSYSQAAHYTDALDAIGFKRGIHLVRVSLDSLLDRFTAERIRVAAGGIAASLLREEDADYDSYSAFESSFEAAGRVEIYMGETAALWSVPSAWQTFETVFDGSFNAAGKFVPPADWATGTPRVADPAPARSSTGDLSLYFAAVVGVGTVDSQVFPGSGHGIWRASEVVGSQGAAFRVRPPADGGLSADQIEASEGSGVLLDPDPVQLSDGSWLVWFGKTDEPLQLASGSASDGSPGGGANSITVLPWFDTWTQGPWFEPGWVPSLLVQPAWMVQPLWRGSGGPLPPSWSLAMQDGWTMLRGFSVPRREFGRPSMFYVEVSR